MKDVDGIDNVLDDGYVLDVFAVVVMHDINNSIILLTRGCYRLKIKYVGPLLDLLMV